MTETFAFADAPKAYDHMLTGAARFRAVLAVHPSHFEGDLA
jgi:D-arabinose 1-dehydrogenase-like Zn-dependent alcohol dehydrogenase